MKKIITFLCIALSLYSFAQPAVNVWRVTPDSVCPGDSVKVDYKCTWPTSPDNTTNYIFMSPVPTILWSGNWSILKARPKEHYSTLAAGDSTYWIKVKIPLGTSVGNHTVYTNNQGVPAIYVKNCSCTITADFSITQVNDSFTLTSTSIGTNSSTVYSWSFYGTYQPGTATTSVTYAPGIYTISLMVTNPTCNDVISKTVTVQITTGIEEYKLNNQSQTPIFLDILGRQVQPEPGGWYIMQIGEVRKQVLIKTQ